jgi:peroxiredoxin
LTRRGPAAGNAAGSAPDWFCGTKKRCSRRVRGECGGPSQQQQFGGVVAGRRILVGVALRRAEVATGEGQHRMKFLKHFNLPLALVVFFVGIIATIAFTMSRPRRNDELLVAAKRLEKSKLPASMLDQVNEKSFLVVYLTSGCKACSDELGLLSDLHANSTGLKIFGIMGEDETVIKNYVRDNNIKFPIIRDRNLDMLRGLKLEFFPTNLVIEDGTIKRAYVGVPESKEKLLALISN